MLDWKLYFRLLSLSLTLFIDGRARIMNIHISTYKRDFFFQKYIRVSYGIGIMSYSLLLRSTVFSLCLCVCLCIVIVVVSVRFVCIQCTSHSLYITINIQHKSLFFGFPNEYMRVHCAICVWLCGVLVTVPLIWRWHCTTIRFYHRIQCHMLVCLLNTNKIDHIVALACHSSVRSQSTSPIKWISQIYFLSLEFDHQLCTLIEGFFLLIPFSHANRLP